MRRGAILGSWIFGFEDLLKPACVRALVLGLEGGEGGMYHRWYSASRADAGAGADAGRCWGGCLVGLFSQWRMIHFFL